MKKVTKLLFAYIVKLSLLLALLVDHPIHLLDMCRKRPSGLPLGKGGNNDDDEEGEFVFNMIELRKEILL